MSDKSELFCPECGLDTEALYEGYCHECLDERNKQLQQHNFSYDRWKNMSDADREKEIREATNGR